MSKVKSLDEMVTDIVIDALDTAVDSIVDNILQLINGKVPNRTIKTEQTPLSNSQVTDDEFGMVDPVTISESLKVNLGFKPISNNLSNNLGSQVVEGLPEGTEVSVDDISSIIRGTYSGGAK